MNLFYTYTDMNSKLTFSQIFFSCGSFVPEFNILNTNY